ncbi:MAG: efflux RND transporter permease subunit [Oscillospiraceae bacterium]|nr:efflux RND transporter permease subunit [Oscillospiraceae bacterium]
MPAFSVKKPLTVFVAVLAIIVLGVVAYIKMTPDLLPNMDFPYAIIVTAYPGASPESVEQEVTGPVEQSMATLEHIKEVTSTSSNSVSMVVLEFEEGVNMDTVAVDIQQKLSALSGQWSDTVATPYVMKINPSMLPVMVTAISYDGKDVHQVSDFVDETLAQKLTGVTGVASVDINGTVDRQLHVILDPEKLDSVSQTVYDAAAKKLDAAQKQLNDAKAQLTAAQKALAEGKAAAADGIGDGVVSAIKKARSALPDFSAPAGGATTGTDLPDLGPLPENPADWPDYFSQIDPQQWTDRISALSAQLEALQKAMTDASKAMESLTDTLNSDRELNKIGSQLSQGVGGLLDAVTLLTKSEMQLDTAMTTIDQGLAALKDTREDLESQTDVGGMLSMSTLSALLTAQDFAMPAGYVSDESGVQYMVSVGDALASEEELRTLVLFDLGLEDVAPIRLEDVATVFVADNSAEIYTKLNGENGVIASFTKQSNYATAQVSENLAARFAALEKEYPGLHFVPLMDQGDYIHLIVNSILSSLLWGALFSVVVLFLFLRDWRPTVITLVSIPVSVIFAIVLMYFSGVTINMISLSGLAVAVGMLVDNSVVVIENIYRLRAKGYTVIQAAVSGAGQVLGAITASTLTTVCVFLPIVFVEGITKQLFTDLALTMCYSLLASLLVALTLVPAMASGLLRREHTVKKGVLDYVYPAYEKALRFSLDHKAGVLLLSLVLLVTTGFAAVQRGFTFMPDMDMNMINVTVTMPEDADMAQAVALTDEVSQRALAVENVETVGAMIASGGGMMGGMTGGGQYNATLYITLPEGKSGNAAGRAIEAACQDLDCTVSASGAMAGMDFITGSGIGVNLYGSDMETLHDAATALAQRMAQVDGVASVSDGLEDAAAALHIAVDREKAMAHGMTVAQVYMKIAAALPSTVTGADVTLDGSKMGVVIEGLEADRVTVENLLDLTITPDSSLSAMASMGSSSAGSAMSSMASMMGGGSSADMSSMMAMMGGSGSVSGSSSALSGAADDSGDGSFRLGDVATAEKTVSLATIRHDEQRRYVTVTAQVAEGRNVTLVTAAVQRAVGSLTLPDGVTLAYSGENEQIMEAMEQLMLMLLLGVILVYFIMVAQFQSLKSPFIVMFTIPLAFTGGFMALLIAGIEISVVSLIGFVMLVGIIVNNGIVLVDYINQQRIAGMARRDAIVDAGVTRMRPIFMTSLTTILGLIVMALARNVGTSLMQPVALVCIGGLLYATLMTLFVVPCIYDMMNKKELRHVDEAELRQVEE